MRRYPGTIGIAFTRKVLWKFYWIALYGDWRVSYSWAVGVGGFFLLILYNAGVQISFAQARSRCAGWSHCLHATGPSMLWWSPTTAGRCDSTHKTSVSFVLGSSQENEARDRKNSRARGGYWLFTKIMGKVREVRFDEDRDIRSVRWRL